MLSGATVWEFRFEDRYNGNFLSYLLQVVKMSIFFKMAAKEKSIGYFHYFKVISGYKLIF